MVPGKKSSVFRKPEQVKTVHTQPEREPQPVVEQIDLQPEMVTPKIKAIIPKVEEITSRKGWIGIFRTKGNDEWTIIAAGGMVSRDRDSIVQAIPPVAEQALIMELDLPFENK